MTWQELAAGLADTAASRRSRWFPAVAAVPRHVLVPAWFYRDQPAGRWRVWDGTEDHQEWLRCTYADKTRVTRVGALHADHAGPDDHPAGRSTSSATQPGLTVRMLRLAGLRRGDAICDMGTGSGYSAALLCYRFGDSAVTSIDVDPYLTKAAGERLAGIGYYPRVHTCDATGPLPGEFDAIIASFSVRACPPSWLTALRPGGRLVFVIAETYLVVVADKQPNGGATGRIDSYGAMFMPARHGPGYDTPGWPAHDGTADQRAGRYPVINLEESADLCSAFRLTAPGVHTRFTITRQGASELRLWDQAGSWAIATGHDTSPAAVQQAGDRQLWDELEAVMDMWVPRWSFPWYRAHVDIDPDGTIHLATPDGHQLTVGDAHG
jgi:protein-L-isoaspartate O-methyltransferase